MEQGHHKEAPTVVRRKRKVARQQREKTPEASKTSRKFSDEESSSTTVDLPEAQNIQIQLRPPGSISSHKSKILGRRDKTFTGAVARSSSTPRVENGTSTEKYDFLRVARRSLSSPRQKEESSESGRSSPRPPQQAQRPPTLPQRTETPQLQPTVNQSDVNKSRSRLEKNMQKFEEERRKFDREKKKFEREKRELTKMRYKHLDPGDRERIAERYRRLSDRVHLPSDSDEKNILLTRFLESQPLPEKPGSRRASIEDQQDPVPPIIENLGDYESSTATMSDSDFEPLDGDDPTDADDEEYHLAVKTREKRNSSRNSSLRRRYVNNETGFDSATTTALVAFNNDNNGKDKQPKNSFFSRIFSIFTIKKKPKKSKKPIEVLPPDPKDISPEELKKQSFVKTLMRLIFIESRQEWKRVVAQYPCEIESMRLERNRCLCDLIILIIFCGFGGLLFRSMEGAFENLYKCGVRRVKRDFIDHLWLTSHNQREEDWKSTARTKLRQFEEELHTAHEAGMTSYSGLKSWNFVNSVLYCLTVVTTIGYGHITPTTVMGRAITIIYAIIGIPIFLILLADFGKLFTRIIKFLWAFVRRVYYTGSCRKIRKQQRVQQMMQGMNIVYEIAMRRPTMANLGIGDLEKGDPETPPSEHPQGSTVETPTSVQPETFLVDDEFNLPISVAITVLLLYIFIGAFVYCIWEDWTYFESFYFVFISMSTIGFGDYVPQHPIFMMASIAYLMFGLALTSMCINVVQVKLSDSFRQASAKIGATIGFAMSEEGALHSQIQTPVEIASIHSSPKFERPPTASIIDQNHRNNNNANVSPPPLPRRSPTKEKDKDKNNKK